MRAFDFWEFFLAITHGEMGIWVDLSRLKEIQMKHQQVRISRDQLCGAILEVLNSFYLEQSLIKCIQIWLRFSILLGSKGEYKYAYLPMYGLFLLV